MRIEHLHFSDSAFQNINEKYSLEEDALFLIQRILTFGTKEDIQLLRRHYGDERIKTELVEVPYLNCMTLGLVSVIFEMDKESFLFYRSMNAKQRKTYGKRPQFLWPNKDVDGIYCDDFEKYFASTQFPDLI